MRKALARSATLVAVTGVIAVAAPTAAHAACVPTMDYFANPPIYEGGTLNTSTGEVIWTWGGGGWASSEGCAGTITVYARLTDRSIAPAGALATTGWVTLDSDTFPDGMNYGYRGGWTTMDVQYRETFTSPMRGGVGQVTDEVKVVFAAVGGPTTTWCEAYTKTFVSTPTGPQTLSETPDTCLP